PWETEPGFFNPCFFAIARLSRLLQLDLRVGFHALHLSFYIFAAYSLSFALRVFTRSRTQVIAAFLLSICVVPVKSLAIFPAFVLGSYLWRRLPCIYDFVWLTSDGFFHGLFQSPLVTFGTATTLLALALIGRYVQSNEARYLTRAGWVVFVSGLM